VPFIIIPVFDVDVLEDPTCKSVFNVIRLVYPDCIVRVLQVDTVVTVQGLLLGPKITSSKVWGAIGDEGDELQLLASLQLVLVPPIQVYVAIYIKNYLLDL
jgi:hypothetical protein